MPEKKDAFQTIANISSISGVVIMILFEIASNTGVITITKTSEGDQLFRVCIAVAIIAILWAFFLGAHFKISELIFMKNSNSFEYIYWVFSGIICLGLFILVEMNIIKKLILVKQNDYLWWVFIPSILGLFPTIIGFFILNQSEN